MGHLGRQGSRTLSGGGVTPHVYLSVMRSIKIFFVHTHFCGNGSSVHCEGGGGNPPPCLSMAIIQKRSKASNFNFGIFFTLLLIITEMALYTMYF